jgi:hypothetical protein
LIGISTTILQHLFLPAPRADRRIASGASAHVAHRSVSARASNDIGISCADILRRQRDGEFDNVKNKNEPNGSNLEYDPRDLIAPLDWMEDDDDDDEDVEINAAEEECEMDVALDTGCVAHCAGPKNLPPATKVMQPKDGKLKNFIAANNTPIENFGVAHVVMETADGKEVGGSFQVAGVGRALHSASVICDTGSKSCPEGHEILTTKRGAVVVPDGALSRYLASVRHVAKYPRRGGLYVAKVKVRTPAAADAKRAADLKARSPTAPAKSAGFGRRNSKR